MERQEPPKDLGCSLSGRSDNGEVCRVGVRVPPFWPEEPAVWFAQVEGQFALSNISNDTTKFYYVISQLEHQYAAEIKDIIITPPPVDKYERLKTELIKRLTTSKEHKIKQLLMYEELGDRKPSQFLRHLQSLAGTTVSDDLMRTIWSNRLPSNLQTIVAMQKSSTLTEVADLVDHVHDIAPSTPMQVASTSAAALPASPLDVLCRQVEQLTKQVESLRLSQQKQTRARYGAHRRNRSRSVQRNGSRSQERPQDHPNCWYHYRFGQNAKKCVSPCSFMSGNAKSSR